MGAETSIRLPSKRELVQERHAAPHQACLLNDHAHDLAKQGHTAVSVVALRRAVAMVPEHPILLACLGAVLFDAGDYAEAERVLSQSVTLEPDYAPAWGNLGSVLCAQNRPAAANHAFERALRIEPEFTDAQWNYAMCLLDHGDWSKAWPYYESRKLRGSRALYPTLPYPTWKGENLNGKTLYVQGEQGIGDRTLMSRYLAWVKAEYPDCKILFMANAEDLPNISNFMWGFRNVCEIIPNGIPWPEADYGIYLMSLPALHGTTPDNVMADPGLIRDNAMRHKNSVSIPTVEDNMLKVGICWTGNPAMKRNAERSIPLEKMLTLAELPNVVLYGLQYRTPDIDRLGAGQLICDLSNDTGPFGFTGTAAAMLNLDLVITNCTSIAHVAGALDVPCWTLLCANPYWLWLRGRDDSVWYPNTRLFRQAAQGDWDPVIARVKSELAEQATAAKRKRAA